MYQLGDIVRLDRGWTPLVVLHVSTTGQVRAKYAKNPDFPVLREHYINPYCAQNCQTRHFSDFVPWDGRPISEKHYIMPRTNNYISNNGQIFGTHIGTKSNGVMLIEDKSGNVHHFHPTAVRPGIPFTFMVRSVSHPSYSCHYTLGKNHTSVSVNDLLLSKSGNLYRVININTEHLDPKGEFKGTRLVQKDL